MNTSFPRDVVNTARLAVCVEAKQYVSAGKVTKGAKRPLHIGCHEFEAYPQKLPNICLIGYSGSKASIQVRPRWSVEILGDICESGMPRQLAGEMSRCC